MTCQSLEDLLCFFWPSFFALRARCPSFPHLETRNQPDHAHRLGMKVRCMCGGCNDSAGGCYHVGGAFSGPCDTALGMLKEINERIAKGESDDLIVQSFVQEYGQAVLTEPPHSGFGRVAWWIPAITLIGGFALVSWALFPNGESV